MKPDAPAEYRGIWKPIRTKVPGLRHHRAVPEAGEGHRQVLDRPLAAPRHRRPLRRRPPDAHDQGHGRQRGEQRRRSSPASARSSTANSARGSPGMPGYVGVPARGQHRPARPATSAATCSAPQHNPFVTGGDPNAPNFQVQNLNLASGLTLDKLEDRRVAAAALRHGAAATSTSAARAQAMDRFAQRGVRVRHRPDGPRGVRHRQGRPAAPRPLRPQQLGPEHAAGPAAGRGRLDVRDGPLRRLGPPLGPAERDTRTTCRRWTPRSRRCSRTWTTAACSTRRWWCCAASSAGRRR